MESKNAADCCRNCAVNGGTIRERTLAKRKHMAAPEIIAEDTPEDSAARRKSRWGARRNLALTAIFLLGLDAANLVRDEQDYQRWHRKAAQYQQDCMSPAVSSQNCRVLPLRVIQHINKPVLDPDDSGSRVEVDLRDQSGQTYKAKIYSRQSDNFQIGDTVTATVWKGEVEKITWGGEAKATLADPVLVAEGAQSSVTISWDALGLGAALVAVLVWAESRVDKAIRLAQLKVRSVQSGNKTS